MKAQKEFEALADWYFRNTSLSWELCLDMASKKLDYHY